MAISWYTAKEISETPHTLILSLINHNSLPSTYFLPLFHPTKRIFIRRAPGLTASQSLYTGIHVNPWVGNFILLIGLPLSRLIMTIAAFHWEECLNTWLQMGPEPSRDTALPRIISSEPNLSGFLLLLVEY